MNDEEIKREVWIRIISLSEDTLLQYICDLIKIERAKAKADARKEFEDLKNELSEDTRLEIEMVLLKRKQFLSDTKEKTT